MSSSTFVPGPAGAPYSSAVVAGNIVYLAGTMGKNPETHQFDNDIQQQAEYCLRNLAAVLEQVGGEMKHIVSATVFLTDFARDFGPFNEVWQRHFPGNPPARATVEVSAMAPGALIEIQAIAVL